MAGGYPCCCLGIGSSFAGSSVDGFPLGSSGSSSGVIVRGSSYAATVPCVSFQGSASPAVLRVEINGITSKTCDECSLLNGVYFVPAEIINHPNRCGWQLEFPAVCGHYTVIYVELLAVDVGDYLWSVLISDRPFIQTQEVLLIGGEQVLAGQISIDDVDNILLETASELNTIRCTGEGSATALISAVV